MKFSHNKLKGLIREKRISQVEMARELKIAPSTFSLKINGIAFFTQEEIQKMAIILDIQDYKKYFFTQEVEKTKQKETNPFEQSNEEIMKLIEKNCDLTQK